MNLDRECNVRILALACLVALAACNAQRSSYETPPPPPGPPASSAAPMGGISDSVTSGSTSNAASGSTATQRTPR
jgi:hypothetical protein